MESIEKREGTVSMGEKFKYSCFCGLNNYEVIAQQVDIPSAFTRTHC